MAESKFKKGQYYAAKYDGINGDLLLGQVKSVRSDGDILLINLLTGSTSTKKASILAQRNKRVSKKQADEIIALWKKTKNKKQVRGFILDLYPFDGHKKHPKAEVSGFGIVDAHPVTPGILIAPQPALERIAVALEKLVEYVGNMKLG